MKTTIPEIDLRMPPLTPAQRPGQIFGRILVGTDFSAAATPVFEQGLKLAKQNRAELLIAHSAVTPNTLSFMPADAYDEWEKRSRAEAQRSIGPLIQKARQEGVKAHMLMLSGFADNAIVKAARRLCVDLIVIGTHRRRAVPRLLLGSMAARIVARAPCAVLTVGTPLQAS